MHIVVLPFPIQGHLNPCLMLTKLLTSHGFTSTLVVTKELATKLEQQDEDSAHSSSIQHAIIDCEGGSSTFIPSGGRTSFNFFETLDMVDRLRPAFEALLRKLMASPPGVSCIIIDCFVTWGPQVASDFSMPAYLFYTTNAHTLSVVLQAPRLIARGFTDPEELVDGLPGLSTLRVGDIPSSIRLSPDFALSIVKHLHKAGGVILNTVSQLEKEPLEVLRSKISIYAVGPMPFMLAPEKSAKGGETVSFWAEERECLDWLDARPEASVLYVAFGSLANLDNAQVKALAEGLEASGQAFLWVIRSNVSLSDLLPDCFMDRTKNRGRIISWAPQMEVLSHPAVGGFFTHCGWNSVTENLSLQAVPMICWPQLGEQRLNRRLLVDKWKVGLELQEEGGTVVKDEVEKAVRELMQGDVRRELRERALKCKETIFSAVQEGGSSQMYLKALAEDIRKLGSNVHSCKSGMHNACK